MPRVLTKTKNRAGKDRACGKCARPILPGEKYRTWSFRYGGTRFRCDRPECAPRPSELTQSLMGSVYAAQESFEDQAAAGFETVADIVTAVEEVAEAAQEVCDQYREAAEPFGGAGEHAERADELESWISELEGFMPEEEPDDEEEAEGDEEAIEDLQQEAREKALTEAQELVNGCPL
jgi:hypothetical protein